MKKRLLIALCSIFSLCHGSAFAFISLEEAETRALENNRNLMAAKEYIERAKQGRLESISRWFPHLIAISAAFKTQKTVIPAFLTATSAYETQLKLTQAIFSTALYYDVKIASLLVQQFDLLYEAAKNDVLFDVRAIYYKILLDYKNIATAQEHICLLSELAKEMEERYQIGTAILYNVNQSKVAIANATSTYYQSVKELKSDHDQLAQILGMDPAVTRVEVQEGDIPVMSIMDLAEKIKQIEQIFTAPGGIEPIYIHDFLRKEKESMARLFSEEEINHWRNLADKYRPDLLLSQNYIHVAEEYVKKNQGDYFPVLNALVNYGGEPTPYFFRPSSQFTNQSFSWGAGVRLDWMIFDGTGRERRILKAKAERSAQKFNYQQTLYSAHAEVLDQIYDIEEAMANYITSLSNVKLAIQTVEQAKQQLAVGYIYYLDYEVAVDSWVQASDTLNRASYDLLIYYYGLRHATGIDVKSDKIMK